MANEGILLRDNKGEDVAYYGVENILVRTTIDGATQSGQQTFAKGEAIEDVEINLALNDGDQSVNAPDGKLIKSAVIKKPDTLLPENIIKDIEIAGVMGTYEGEVIPDHTETDFTLHYANKSEGVLGIGYTSSGKASFEAAPEGEEIEAFVDTNFVPANIKKDVSIFGVTGTYEGEGGGANETDIFPLQTVSGFDYSLIEGTHSTVLERPPLFTLTAGETYIVEWNGAEYNCKAYEITFNGAQAIYIGNGSALGYEGNGEPFCITYNITQNGTQFITTETDREYTIRVYQKSEPSVDIQPLDITENGLYTAPDGVAYSPITVNVPITDKELFPTEEISPFSQHPELPVYWLAEGHLFTLTIGETYSVDWDGETYTCVAQDLSSMGEGYVGIGNLSLAGGSSNNEPFAIVDALTTTMFMSADTTSTSHTIRVYQKVKSSSSFPFEVEEIFPETSITCEVGKLGMISNTPATEIVVKDSECLHNGESGIVVFDGIPYGVTVSDRLFIFDEGEDKVSVFVAEQACGNLGIPSMALARPTRQDLMQTSEPFMTLPVDMTEEGDIYLVVAIPEDSTEMTHTLQIFKFI